MYNDIVVYEGAVGTCKTLLTTLQGYKHYKKGIDVRANYDLFFPPHKNAGKIIRWHDPLELRRAHDCCILIDEAQLKQDNRDFMSLPKPFYDMLPQFRHRRISLILNTQNLEGVDIKIRRLAHHIIYCNTIRFLRIPWNIHKQAWFQISTTSEWPFIHFISKLWTKKLYDSFADTGLEPSSIKVLIKNKTVRTIIKGNTT